VDDLQVLRDRDHAAEHARADDEAAGQRDDDDAVLEDLQRDERMVTRATLGPDEGCETDHADDVREDRVGGRPAPRTALLRDEEQRYDADDQRRGAEPVNDRLALDVVQVQRGGDGDEREDANRYVE